MKSRSFLVALVLILGVCLMAPSSVASAATKKPPISITLSIAPKEIRKDTQVTFSVRATVRSARGAIGYSVIFGDGSHVSPPLPQFCLAHRHGPLTHHFVIRHRYRKAGTFRVIFHFREVCAKVSKTVARSIVVKS